LKNTETCTYKEGYMHPCGPLAVPMVHIQQSSQPAFDSAEALEKGTLFPGLNLPFMDYVSTGTMEDTPLSELMALDFVTQELSLYLDTHPDDQEAFETWKSFTALAAEGQRRYVELYGAVTRPDTSMSPSWTWPDDPWPWDTMGKAGKN
jgi:spore coat protein JB